MRSVPGVRPGQQCVSDCLFRGESAGGRAKLRARRIGAVPAVSVVRAIMPRRRLVACRRRKNRYAAASRLLAVCGVFGAASGQLKRCVNPEQGRLFCLLQRRGLHGFYIDGIIRTIAQDAVFLVEAKPLSRLRNKFACLVF